MSVKNMASKASTDRRILRTRAAIETAFLGLIREKGYTAVSVEDICREANVGRSTFYAHHAGKNDLKRSSIDRHFRHLAKAHKAGMQTECRDQHPFGFTLPFFLHAKEQAGLYMALVAKGGIEVTLDMLRATITRLAREDMAAFNPSASAAERETAAQFFTGAFLSVLTAWLDSGARTMPEAINAQFHGYLQKGLMLGKPRHAQAAPTSG